MSTSFEHLLQGIPSDAWPCWVIDEQQKIRGLKEKRLFTDFNPSCYFKLKQRHDNNFIEGHLGHVSFKGNYHADTSSNYTYFQDFNERKPVYFSFDKITLYQLIEIIPGSPLTAMLKRIDSPKAFIPNKAFMIMPFGDEKLNTLYKNDIKVFLENDKDLKTQIFRADDFNGNDIIVETIYNQIEQAEFIIADISYPNKNVFYELGWASAMEKEIITIQNKEVDDNIFFDRSHIRTRLYSLKDIPELLRQLKNDIIAIRDKMG